MGKFVEFAKSELERAGLFGEKDFYGGMTGKAVLELCEVFEMQGHSGASASLVASLFDQLAKWKPITPLTGDDSEWEKLDDGTLQNKRAPNVFKENGVAYQVDYFIFEEEDGTTYTSKYSRKKIKFPYVPSHEIVPAALEKYIKRPTDKDGSAR